MTNPTSRLKDVRCVVGDDVDAIELGERLGGHGNKNSGFVSTKHVLICSLAFLALKKDVHLDLAILVSSLRIMNIATSVQVSNDHHPFFIMVVVQKPSVKLASHFDTYQI